MKGTSLTENRLHAGWVLWWCLLHFIGYAGIVSILVQETGPGKETLFIKYTHLEYKDG